MNGYNLKETNINNFPKDWKLVRLKDLVYNFISGGTPSTKDSSFWNGSIPWITSAHVDSFLVDSGEKTISESGLNSSATNIVPKGNLLIATRVGIGKVAVNLIDIAISQDLTGAIIKKDKALNDFLCYALLSSKAQNIFKSVVRGSTIKGIARSELEKIKVLVPPLPEQKKIAEILSTVDQAIEKVDEATKKTERLKKGLMQQLFQTNTKKDKWDMVKTKSIFSVETGTTPSTKKQEYWKDGEINWITPTDLNKLNNQIYLSKSIRKITKKALYEINLSLLPIDTIVISTRAPVGYVTMLKENATINQGCKGLITEEKTKILPEFYCYYFLSKRYTLQNLSSGSTFKELSKDNLEKLFIPLPSLSEQRQISNILITIDKRLELLRKKKEKLEHVKKGLMNDLLTGRKRVKLEA